MAAPGWGSGRRRRRRAGGRDGDDANHDGTGGEYQYDGPATVPAGPVRVTLANQGSDDHHAQVLRLDDGATLDDLQAALATGDPAATTEVGTFVGGTGLVSPGNESRADAVLDLDPGHYVLLCFVPDGAGVPHVAHGMLRPFEVTGADDPPPTAEIRAGRLLVLDLDPGRYVLVCAVPSPGGSPHFPVAFGVSSAGRDPPGLERRNYEDRVVSPWSVVPSASAV